MPNEKFVHALAHAATVFAQRRGQRDFMPNKRRDDPPMYPVSKPTPAPPVKLICRACEVVSTDAICWSCDGPMEEIANQSASLSEVAGAKSDDYAGLRDSRSYYSNREPRPLDVS
jgi:hypothetical protein